MQDRVTVLGGSKVAVTGTQNHKKSSRDHFELHGSKAAFGTPNPRLERAGSTNLRGWEGPGVEPIPD
jgi:hypothetical protein